MTNIVTIWGSQISLFKVQISQKDALKTDSKPLPFTGRWTGKWGKRVRSDVTKGAPGRFASPNCIVKDLNEYGIMSRVLATHSNWGFIVSSSFIPKRMQAKSARSLHEQQPNYDVINTFHVSIGSVFLPFAVFSEDYGINGCDIWTLQENLNGNLSFTYFFPKALQLLLKDNSVQLKKGRDYVWFDFKKH